MSCLHYSLLYLLNPTDIKLKILFEMIIILINLINFHFNILDVHKVELLIHSIPH